MPLVEDDLDFLCSLVFKRSGNVLSRNQGYLVESRLRPVATTIGLPDVETLVAELKRPNGVRLHNRIAEAMTINETMFFRDLQPFELLKKQILPELIERRRTEKEIRIWSSACSSGQEPFSIAMTIRENFPELESWRIQILATDLDGEMVERTQSGTYSQFDVNRGLPAKMLLKYFDRCGTQWQAKPEIRQMIHARQLNLLDPLSSIPVSDIVFLRNVLIYFDAATKGAILSRVHGRIASDGYLFLGGGETLVKVNAAFNRIDAGPAVVYQPN